MTFFTLVVENRSARSSSTTRQSNSLSERSRSGYLKARCPRIHKRFTAQHLSGLAQVVKSYLGPGSCLAVPLLQSNPQLPRLLHASGRRSPLTGAPINENHCVTAPTSKGKARENGVSAHEIPSLNPDLVPRDQHCDCLAFLWQCSI